MEDMAPELSLVSMSAPRTEGRIKKERAAPTLSIVIPVYNERGHIAGTISEAARVAAEAGFEADFIVVDDGSTDGSGDAADSVKGTVRINVIRQPNRGRIAARRAGLAEATGAYTMFLDSRVKLEQGGLAFVREQIDEGKRVWNSHVTIDTANNPFGKFWKVVAYLAWPDYLRRPRTMSFGVEEFDHYPKGTAGFIAPTSLMREAFAQFGTYYEDERFANDDTSIIRWIAGRERINLSPRYACTYKPRTTFSGFMRHSYHRGIVFLDGHGRPESRFFPAVLAFYPLSVAAIVLAVRRPGLAAVAAVTGTAAVFGALRVRGFPRDESAAFASLAPFYAAAHGAGMWKGLAMMVGRRARRPRT